ncbi:MAG: hypothetical protein QME84_00690 [Actinomycetota bacterium]|jgi:hypothetical protein|nr:hypothetical protein [Actinomycetota bacterium]
MKAAPENDGPVTLLTSSPVKVEARCSFCDKPHRNGGIYRPFLRETRPRVEIFGITWDIMYGPAKKRFRTPGRVPGQVDRRRAGRPSTDHAVEKGIPEIPEETIPEEEERDAEDTCISRP